jgi:hypothetical protein
MNLLTRLIAWESGMSAVVFAFSDIPKVLSFYHTRSGYCYVKSDQAKLRMEIRKLSALERYQAIVPMPV